MLFRLSFVTLIIAAVTLGTPVKRDVPQIEQDVQNLGAQSKTLDQSILAFPTSGGTSPQLYAIHKASIDLESLLNTTADDVSVSASFTDAQAKTIFGEAANNFEPNIKEVLAGLIDKKAGISALNATSIIESDLQSLKIATDALAKEFVAKTPADLAGDLQEQLAAIDTAFSSVINAYSA